MLIFKKLLDLAETTVLRPSYLVPRLPAQFFQPLLFSAAVRRDFDNVLPSRHAVASIRPTMSAASHLATRPRAK